MCELDMLLFRANSFVLIVFVYVLVFFTEVEIKNTHSEEAASKT